MVKTHVCCRCIYYHEGCFIGEEENCTVENPKGEKYSEYYFNCKDCKQYFVPKYHDPRVGTCEGSTKTDKETYWDDPICKSFIPEIAGVYDHSVIAQFLKEQSILEEIRIHHAKVRCIVNDND